MKAIWALLPLIKHQRGSVVLMGVLHALSAVLNLFTFLSVVPFLRILFASGTDSVQGHSDGGAMAQASSMFDAFVQENGATQSLALLCGVMVVLAVLKNAVHYAALYVMAGIRTGVSRDLRQGLYEQLMSMPLAWLSESKRGDIMSRFTHDLMEVEHSVIGSLEALLKSPLMILVSLVTLIALSWKLTLFAFVLLPVTGALISRWSKRLKRHAQKGKEELGHLVAVLEETLLGMRVLKAFNAEAQFASAYARRNHGHFKAMRRMHRRESMSSPMSEVVSLSVMALLLAYGGSLVLEGNSALSGDWFIGYLVVFSQIIPPARSLSDGYFRVSKGAASLERLEGLFDGSLPTELDLGKSGMPAPKWHKAIEFKDVVYRYPDQDIPALNGLNLTIPAGKVVALVGTSGSGKTTTAHLLSKFANPTSGVVEVDGIDLKSISGTSWRSRLAVVTQDAILFQGSIADNIVLGDPQPDDARMKSAAEAAHVLEFAEAMPDGLETMVGDSGGKLSGGQRQRVALARALYRDADLILLDEATSALDAESESIVQQALGQVLREKTVVVIAHRMSTVREADMVVVLDAGKAIEWGSHEELLASGGRYAELTQLQQGV